MQDDVQEDQDDTERSGVDDFEKLYTEVATNCFRLFGFTSFSDVDRLTIPEYQILCKAYELRSIDQDYRAHLQAWLNVQAGAQKEQGKKLVPVYKRFSQFFDYEKELAKVEKKKDDRFTRIAQKMKERRQNLDG